MISDFWFLISWSKIIPGRERYRVAIQSPDMNPIEDPLDQMAIHIRDMFNPPTTAA